MDKPLRVAIFLLFLLILSCEKPAALQINDDIVANYIRAFERNP